MAETIWRAAGVPDNNVLTTLLLFKKFSDAQRALLPEVSKIVCWEDLTKFIDTVWNAQEIKLGLYREKMDLLRAGPVVGTVFVN